MTRTWIAVSIALGLTTAATSTLIAEGLGYFRMGDVRVELHHAYAFLVESVQEPGEVETHVILSDRELDAEAIGAGFDVLSAADDQIRDGGGLVRIVVAPDGAERGLYFTNTEPPESFNTNQGEFSTTTLTRERIEGTWTVDGPQEFFDKTFEFSLRFAADISDAQLAGDPLPAGGGEAGAAYLAKHKALFENDVETLRAMLGEEAQWALPDDDSEEDLVEKIEWMRYGWPVEVAITGGLDRGDVVILRVEGKDEDGETVRGRVLMEKSADGWEQSTQDLETVYSS